MSPTRLLQTTAFRPALAYMGLFASSVLLSPGFIYWSTVAYMAEQTDANIGAEITGLAEQYRERGLEGLAATITERLERDPDSSSVYLFTTPGLQPLAGNLSAWPEMSPAGDGWLDFEFEDPGAGGRLFRFSIRIEPAICVDAGRDLLFQAIINLLDNAVKYTPDGGRVAIELKRDGAGVDIAVCDSGPGIAEDERAKVGQRFYRLESSRSTPGSGLGPSLVRAVARLHRAELIFADNAPRLVAIFRMRSAVGAGAGPGIDIGQVGVINSRKRS